MNMWMILSTLFVLSQAQAGVLTCTGQVAGKTETFRARLDDSNRLVWWNDTQVINAPASTALRPLAAPDRDRIEGKAFIVGRNNYKILSVTTSAESAGIGVSPDLKNGFYTYRDEGSGRGNQRIALSCEPDAQAKAAARANRPLTATSL